MARPVDVSSPSTTDEQCARTAEHQAHMELNGECPWCGTYDPDQGGATVEEVVARYG